MIEIASQFGEVAGVNQLLDPSRLRVVATTHRADAENRPLSSAASTHACAQFQVRGGNQPRWYSGLSESRFACRGARRQRAHRTVVHCATVWQAGLRVAGWHTGIVYELELAVVSEKGVLLNCRDAIG